MRKVSIALAALGALVAAACAVLPERYAVNVPLRSFVGDGIDAPDADQLDARIRVPDGFEVGLYAEGITRARFLHPLPNGDLLVSTPGSGRVVVVERDADGDGRSDGQRVLLDGLNRPHGLDWHDGWLYVGETDAVARVRFDPETAAVEGTVERVVTGIPGGGGHWTRTLRFGPDGWLYVTIGSSCNVCEEEDPRRAAIVRYRPDGSGEEIFATGLRNAVGIDWHPRTGELFATDNGRDLLGDDFPPCELNRVVRSGFYGWPYRNGDNVPDPDLGDAAPASADAAIPPVHDFRAHNAPLGIRFLRGGEVSPGYRGAALVALHGSWNRTRKDGYKVVSLHWDASGRIEERDFVTGFERDGDVIGRPVDVTEGADGAVYVSDDYAGAIYRVRWPRAAGG